MNEAMRTHGAFSWSELQTADVAAAKAFYGEVLGWEIEAMDLPNGSYTMIKAGARPLGGIVPAVRAVRLPLVEAIGGRA